MAKVFPAESQSRETTLLSSHVMMKRKLQQAENTPLSFKLSDDLATSINNIDALVGPRRSSHEGANRLALTTLNRITKRGNKLDQHFLPCSSEVISLLALPSKKKTAVAVAGSGK